ncbi:MAG: hypothetical protein ACLPUT_09515 [Solirubrobacteraceae bacterium]
MSAALAGIALASGVQGGHARAPFYETFVIALVITLMALAVAQIATYLRRRHLRPKPVTDEWQALAVMGELCPDGWQAKLTLYGWGAPVPDDAPPARVPPVELEWKQFDEEPGHVVVERRVWAPTIEAALQTMVDDRRTDLTLEQIERAADEDEDVRWND